MNVTYCTFCSPHTHTQTREQRSAAAKLKQKRKAMMKARLAKVKQRKLVREGKLAEGEEAAKDEGECWSR